MGIEIGGFGGFGGGGAPSGAAGGDLSGTYPNPGVVNDSHLHSEVSLVSMMPLLSSSSLGIIQTTGKVKFLTVDNRLYVSDGTLWRPVDTPGWPRRDGADDTEWEITNADPPAGWAWDTQDSWVVDVNNTRKSCLQLTRATATGNFTTLYRSATFTSAGKTIFGVLEVLSSGSIAGNSGRAGIILRNSSNGRAVILYIEYEANVISVRVFDLNNATSGTLKVARGNVILSLVTPFIFAIQNDGTNLNFRVAPYGGGAESDFETIYSETLASFLTAAGGDADQYGYIMNLNSGSQTLKIISDWIRVV